MSKLSLYTIQIPPFYLACTILDGAVIYVFIIFIPFPSDFSKIHMERVEIRRKRTKPLLWLVQLVATCALSHARHLCAGSLRQCVLYYLGAPLHTPRFLVPCLIESMHAPTYPLYSLTPICFLNKLIFSAMLKQAALLVRVPKVVSHLDASAHPPGLGKPHLACHTHMGGQALS